MVQNEDSSTRISSSTKSRTSVREGASKEESRRSANCLSIRAEERAREAEPVTSNSYQEQVRTMKRTRVCSSSGCPTLVEDGLRCEKHPEVKRVYKKHKLTNTLRGYGTAHRKWRASVLKRDRICRDCGVAESTDAHHIDGNPRNRVVGNGMGLCRRCHNRRTHGRTNYVPHIAHDTSVLRPKPKSSVGEFWFA